MFRTPASYGRDAEHPDTRTTTPSPAQRYGSRCSIAGLDHRASQYQAVCPAADAALRTQFGARALVDLLRPEQIALAGLPEADLNRPGRLVHRTIGAPDHGEQRGAILRQSGQDAEVVEADDLRSRATGVFRTGAEGLRAGLSILDQVEEDLEDDRLAERRQVRAQLGREPSEVVEVSVR